MANLATGTQKETVLQIPFVVAISGTKFLTNFILVRQNSAQLGTEALINPTVKLKALLLQGVKLESCGNRNSTTLNMAVSLYSGGFNNGPA